MIKDMNELFQDIESRIGRKLTQAEILPIRGEVAVNAISKESEMEEVSRSIADRIIGLRKNFRICKMWRFLMNPNEYQKLAMRTNDGKASYRLTKTQVKHAEIDIGGVFNACLGLSGEVGEFNDMIKKWVFHEKELDVDHLKKECGDILWYIAMMCQSFGWDLEEIMQMNIDKLKARYPEGFDPELSNHRKENDV